MMPTHNTTILSVNGVPTRYEFSYEAESALRAAENAAKLWHSLHRNGTNFLVDVDGLRFEVAVSLVARGKKIGSGT